MQVKLPNEKNRGVYKVGVVNLNTATDFLEEKDVKRLNKDYIPFGDNGFLAYELAELRRKSSTHRSILAQKKLYISGNGFMSENEKLDDYLANINADNESFYEVWEKIVDDFNTFGNAYIEVVEYQGGCNIYHLDATKCLIAKNRENLIVHPDFQEYNRLKDKARTIPFYPEFANEDGFNRSVLHIKRYEPEFQYYGLPDYIGALQHIVIDYEIGRWNKSRFDNNFMPSAIIELSGSMSDEEADNLIEEAKAKLTGEGNNGKILFLVKDGGEKSEITLINDNADGSFMDLQALTNQNIITAHRWQPSLSGVVSSGKMNSTGSEIRIAYELIMSTVAKSTINTLLPPLLAIIEEKTGLDTSTLQIKHEPPVSYMTDVALEKVATINEMRGLLGLEAIEGMDRMLEIKTQENADIQ